MTKEEVNICTVIDSTGKSSPPDGTIINNENSTRALSKKNRIYVLHEFLHRIYPSITSHQNPKILDVAGGRGDLSWILKNIDGINSIIADPRVPNHKRLVKSVQFLLDHPMIGHQKEHVRHQSVLEEIRNIRSMHKQLPFSIGYLAYSLIDFHTLILEREGNSSESAKEFANKCTESLEKYIALRSRATKKLCHTCHEEDTPDHKGLVCQGCRVVSYCCKDHQRLNYLHQEVTGTRGLGHKHLCPVFKAYRRKRDNTDTSKDWHFDRKFQRACKRFLRGTLESV